MISTTLTFCFVISIMLTTATLTTTPETPYGNNCFVKEQCLTSGAECINTRCICNYNTFYDVSSDICKLKIAYNATCNDVATIPSSQCTTTQAYCINNTCLCKDGVYYKESTDSCEIRPVLDTAPIIYLIETTQFSIAWQKMGLNGFYEIFMTVYDIQNHLKECIKNQFFPSCTVSGLNAGTQYHIEYYIKDKNRDVPSIIYTTFTYTAPLPTPEPTSWERWEKNVTLRWDNNDHNCEYYILTITPPPSVGNNSVRIPGNEKLHNVTFDNLSGGINYTVTIKAVAGNNTASITSSHYTRPIPVSIATMRRRTNSSIDVNIVYNGINSEHIKFIAYIDPPLTTDACDSCNNIIHQACTKSSYCGASSNFTITGLQDGTLYNLSIYAVLDGLTSENEYFIQEHITFAFNKTCNDVTTTPSSQCTTTQAYCINNTCLCKNGVYYKETTDSCEMRPILESAPRIFGIENHRFMIDWLLMGLKKTYDIMINVYDIHHKMKECYKDPDYDFCVTTGLEAGTKYRIEYYIIDINQDVPSISHTLFTYTAPLPPPEPTSWERLETNVTLRWDNNNHNCEYYILSITPPPSIGNNSVRIPGNEKLHNVTFDNLSGGINYTVTIKAVAGNNIASITSSHYTRPISVSNATIDGQTSSSLDVNAVYNEVNSEQTKFLAYIDPSLTTDACVSCNNILQQNCNKSFFCGESSRFTITGLQDRTLYNVSIYAVLDGLTSVNGYFLKEYTRPNGPSVPVIGNITSSGFDVTYNGESSNFDLFSIKVCFDNESVCQLRQNTTNKHFTVSNLTAGTNYKVTVNTVLQNGLESLQPQTISSFTRPNGPVGINVTQLHDTNVTITLNTMNNFYNHIEVDLYVAGNRDKVKTVNGSIVSGLVAAIEYKIDVFTATITGLRSSESISKTFTTKSNFNGKCNDDGFIPSNQCITTNAVCINNKCQCLNDTCFHNFDSDSCEHKIAYNEKCNDVATIPSTQCTTSQAYCINNTCLCKDGVYHKESTDSCEIRLTLDSELIIYDVQSTQFKIAWDEMSLNSSYNLVIVVFDRHHNMKECNIIDARFQFCIVTGLEAGTKYRVEYYVNDINRDVPSINYTIFTYTAPLPPPEPTSWERWEKNVTLRWDNNNHTCEYYILSITPQPSDGNNSVRILGNEKLHNVIFDNLSGGINYTVTIKAVAGNNTASITSSHFTRPISVSKATIGRRTNSSLDINVVYNEGNSKDTQFIAYIDPSLTTEACDSCDNIIQQNCTKSFYCGTSSKFTVTGLQDGTLYNLSIYSVVEGLTAENEYFIQEYTGIVNNERNFKENDSKTSSSITTGMMSAIIVGLIVVAVATAVVVVVLRRKQILCFDKSNDSQSDHEYEDLDELERQTQNVAEYMTPEQINTAKVIDAETTLPRLPDRSLINQFKRLNEKSPSHSMTVAEANCNRVKNREDVLAFDHSRVNLSSVDSLEGSDYINANFIPGHTLKREYIATQGPMQATFGDFWRMIWEQNVDTIVMLTKLVENGKTMCDKYWPDVSETLKFDLLEVTSTSETMISDYIERVIQVKKQGELRTIHQFCYLKWSSKEVPEPSAFLDFLQEVRNFKTPEQTGNTSRRPLVVHCSDGVGRTGTFIAVDTMIQNLRNDYDVDIFNIVLEMRNYRCNMVLTESQYTYIHRCYNTTIDTGTEETGYETTNRIYINTHIRKSQNVHKVSVF